ncbi:MULTISPECIES: carbon starvation protein A [Clostridium]|uniref:Carbon starvation protein A n=1 Tax=Clostridium ragsdalei P11 TaxID=1353534 RepID=A0A1A6B1N7_9CLOT|nr:MULTISPECIES: carbon starvation protein A [Clostridium]OBR96207.1 carbon starvation protein A [Clostridium ragsdalei P11]QXE18673.1 carbon starvation protein A [Clostridium sp. 001]
MNAITLVIIAALVLIIAYRYYGYFIATKVLMIDPDRETPANKFNDGRDYVPTNKWVVFGHHFAAIAGAGPLIGPVLAAQFGYMPGYLWLLIGAVLGGGVHDMVILFASVRHDGKSLAEIAKEEVGRITGTASSIAVLLIVILSMAGLAIVIVNALYSNPWGTFTVTVTIPIAMFIGIYMRYIRPGKIGEASAIGVILVLLGVVLGPAVKASSLASYFTLNETQLKLVLPAYGFLAATLPVWFLLAPRDYLSSYMKIGTILVLALGIVFVRPTIAMPAVTKFAAGGGPIIPGPLWPFLMITIACGAISGFHALISSGTTPKLIDNEKSIPMIGYGAMLAECFVGVMALIAATVLQPGDYFAINTSAAAFSKLQAAGYKIVNLPQLSQLVGENIAHRPGGAVSLAVGMAYIFSRIPFLKYLMSYWYQFAIMFEALFILTTIDAGTRVGRFIVQDIAGKVYKPLKRTDWWPGIIITSGLVSFAWGYLLFGGSISTIWPIFGVANQLLATLALTIGTTIILKHSKKRSYALITLIPMLALLVTTVGAGTWSIFKTYIPKNMILNSFLMTIMIAIVIIVVVDSASKWSKIIKD